MTIEQIKELIQYCKQNGVYEFSNDTLSFKLILEQSSETPDFDFSSNIRGMTNVE